jgi:hypothetical protein
VTFLWVERIGTFVRISVCLFVDMYSVFGKWPCTEECGLRYLGDALLALGHHF